MLYVDELRKLRVKLPTFLNTKEKWDTVVSDTDNIDKYEVLVSKLLKEKLDTNGFFKILYSLTLQIYKKHEKCEILRIIHFLECLFMNISEKIEKKMNA